MHKGEGGREGVWDPKVCVPKMAQPDFPNFVVSRDGHFGLGGRSRGGYPPPPPAVYGHCHTPLAGHHRCRTVATQHVTGGGGGAGQAQQAHPPPTSENVSAQTRCHLFRRPETGGPFWRYRLPDRGLPGKRASWYGPVGVGGGCSHGLSQAHGETHSVFVSRSGAARVVPLLTSAASASWRPSHAAPTRFTFRHSHDREARRVPTADDAGNVTRHQGAGRGGGGLVTKQRPHMADAEPEGLHLREVGGAMMAAGPQRLPHMVPWGSVSL